MNITRGNEVLTGLVRGVLDARPLIDELEHPIKVPPPCNGERSAEAGERAASELENLLNQAAARVGAPAFAIRSGTHSAFELAISNRLRLASCDAGDLGLLDTEIANEIIDAAAAASFDSRFFRGKVKSSDGAFVRTYTAGQRSQGPVVIVTPCGMPAKLCERWVDLLAQEHFVVTWETRLLFDERGPVDLFAFDVEAQVSDLFAVMDHFDLAAAHVIGLCGGAVVAVSAAAAQPSRVSSLSVWHGDFELGAKIPKTKHQRDLKAFMLAAAMGRPQAVQLHKLFAQNTLKNFRSDAWAHIVLYPYASAELLYRYARANGSIMKTDVTPLLAGVTQPCLVVTSSDDATTHPEGSKRVAQLLPEAELVVLPHGDHLSLFNAPPEATKLMKHFLTRENCFVS